VDSQRRHNTADVTEGTCHRIGGDVVGSRGSDGECHQDSVMWGYAPSKAGKWNVLDDGLKEREEIRRVQFGNLS
jgi:hypothetical protein